MMLHYEQNENEILSKLLPEYVSVYRIELNSGEHMFGTFDEFAKIYAENFILEEEKEEFTD